MAREFTILALEPDPVNREVISEEMSRTRLASQVNFVCSQGELIDYLKRKGRYADKEQYPAPSLLLLALNISDMQDYEFLSQLVGDTQISRLPKIVMSHDVSQEVVLKAYQLGINSVIRSPLRFESLLEIMKVIENYWFGVVRLPEPEQHR